MSEALAKILEIVPETISTILARQFRKKLPLLGIHRRRGAGWCDVESCRAQQWPSHFCNSRDCHTHGVFVGAAGTCGVARLSYLAQG